MVDFDNLNSIYSLDKNNYLGSIAALPKQISQAWQEVGQLQIPENFGQILNIVVSGMGGSALGPEMIWGLYSDEISYPFEVVHDYKLPYYIGRKSLVILDSYSGNTEETLSVSFEAIEKGARVFAISTGGQLIDLFKQKNLPFYQFEPIHNPCNQPRAGIGYSVSSILGLFKKIAVVGIFDEEINQAVAFTQDMLKKFSASIPTSNNLAKQIAVNINGKIPVIVGAEPLTSNAHIFANQLNETAKTFASCFVIPELNHHLLEGFTLPKDLSEHLYFVFIESELYDSKITRRTKLTKEIISQKNIPIFEYQVEAKTRLQAAFEVLTFSSYVAFYAAMLADIDPTPIQVVEEFKKRLQTTT